MSGARKVDGMAWSGTRRRYPAGHTLFREGDRSGPVFVVREGSVAVEVLTPAGRAVLLAVKGPGEMVGELAAILGSDRSATATAREPVVVDVVTPAAFREALAARTDLMASLLAKLARDVRAVGAEQVRRSDGSVTQRVAAGLLSLAERAIEHDTAGQTSVRIGHDDLAAWVGASRESVSRSLGELRRAGVVSTGRCRITIPDLTALHAHAEPAAV